jgi:hypothetical protein
MKPKGGTEKMITKITQTKLFFPAVCATLFICTCFLCSCYTTDIIKPEPEKMAEESNDDIKTIGLKNGAQIPGENRQIELNYDSQLQKLALTYNISMETIKVSENTTRISYKRGSIPLDSIKYIKYEKINAGMVTLAVIGGVVVILAIVLIFAAGNLAHQTMDYAIHGYR